MKVELNKFIIEVDEMNCKNCSAITGHAVINKRWTCCVCGGKEHENIGLVSRFLRFYKRVVVGWQKHREEYREWLKDPNK